MELSPIRRTRRFVSEASLSTVEFYQIVNSQSNQALNDHEHLLEIAQGDGQPEDCYCMQTIDGTEKLLTITIRLLQPLRGHQVGRYTAEASLPGAHVA
jgi:hypothetical protein